MKSGLCVVSQRDFPWLPAHARTPFLFHTPPLCVVLSKRRVLSLVIGKLGEEKLPEIIATQTHLFYSSAHLKNTRADSLSAHASRLSSQAGVLTRLLVLPLPHPCPELTVTLRMCVVLADAGTLPGARAWRSTLSVTSLVLPNLNHFQKCLSFSKWISWGFIAHWVLLLLFFKKKYSVWLMPYVYNLRKRKLVLWARQI